MKKEAATNFGLNGPATLCIAGPNGSGKSSIMFAIGGLGAQPDDSLGPLETLGIPQSRFINPDRISKEIREAIPGLSQEDSDAYASRFAERKRREFAESRVSFGFETVGSHPSKVEFLWDLKAKGFYVAVLFVSTEDPEINLCRVAARAERGFHDVPKEKVVGRYGRTMGLLKDYYVVADFIAVYDNSTESETGETRSAQLLLTKGADSTLIVTPYCAEVRWVHTYLLDLL